MLDDVPNLLNRVEVAALRRQELLLEVDLVEELLDQLCLVHAEVVHDHHALVVEALGKQASDKSMEALCVIGPSECGSVQEPTVNTQGTYHADRLASGVWQLHLHAWLDPHFMRLLPEVERGLINVDDLYLRLLHEYGGDGTAEVLLLLTELLLPFVLRLVHYLRLAVACTELSVASTHCWR